MENFRIIDVQTSANELQKRIRPETVAEFTETMELMEYKGENFTSLTVFGDFFTFSYDHIKEGVRFTLLDCPNALSMTITTGFPPECDKVIIHSTINRSEKQQEFIEEWQEFLDEWETGIRAGF